MGIGQDSTLRLKQASTEFLRGYFSTHERGKKTKAAYTADINQFQSFVGDIELVSLSSIHIETWAAHLQKEKYSPTSIRRKMVTLRVFCSYWMRSGVLSDSPFWRVKLSFGRVEQLPRSLTEREMKKLLAQALRDYSGINSDESNHNGLNATSSLVEQSQFRNYRKLRNLALLELLFATGMRVGEVSALDVKDFFVKEGVFRVQGKGGRDRLAFIVDKETIQIQRKHLEIRMKIDTKSPALFLNPKSERLSTQGIANVITRFRQDAKIERHITPHMLRHTVATLLLRNGADIRVVQEFLGHASIATTQRYTHISKEHMIRVLKKRHPSLNFREKS